MEKERRKKRTIARLRDGKTSHAWIMPHFQIVSAPFTLRQAKGLRRRLMDRRTLTTPLTRVNSYYVTWVRGESCCQLWFSKNSSITDTRGDNPESYEMPELSTRSTKVRDLFFNVKSHPNNKPDLQVAEGETRPSIPPLRAVATIFIPILIIFMIRCSFFFCWLFCRVDCSLLIDLSWN